MLSKVLTGKDTLCAVPLLLVPAFPGGEKRRNASPTSSLTSSDSGQEDTDHYRREVVQLREELRRTVESAARESQQAHENGRREGHAQAQAELQPVIERMSAAIVDIAALRPDLRRQAERDVVHLALVIARRVLHRELQIDENALTALARFAFDRMGRSESYHVRVHPRFAQSVSSALRGGLNSAVHIEPDPSCAPGTLTIRSAGGVVDASIDGQLDEITNGLTDRIA